MGPETPPGWARNPLSGDLDYWDGSKWLEIRPPEGTRVELLVALSGQKDPAQTVRETPEVAPNLEPQPSGNKALPITLWIALGVAAALLLVLVLATRGEDQTSTASQNSATSQSPDSTNMTSTSQNVFTTSVGIVDEFKPGLAVTPIRWMTCDKYGAIDPIEIRVNYTGLPATSLPTVKTAIQTIINDLETATNNLKIVIGDEYTQTPTNTSVNQRAGRSELRQIYIIFAPDGTLFLNHKQYPALKDQNQGMRRRWHSELARIQAGYIQIDPTWISTQTLEQTQLALARQLLRTLGLEIVDTGNEMLTVATKNPGKGEFFNYVKTTYQYGSGETKWLATAGNTELCK